MLESGKKFKVYLCSFFFSYYFLIFVQLKRSSQFPYSLSFSWRLPTNCSSQKNLWVVIPCFLRSSTFTMAGSKKYECLFGTAMVHNLSSKTYQSIYLSKYIDNREWNRDKKNWHNLCYYYRAGLKPKVLKLYSCPVSYLEFHGQHIIPR